LPKQKAGYKPNAAHLRLSHPLLAPKLQLGSVFTTYIPKLELGNEEFAAGAMLT
jgi:hypothetical protein